MITILGGHTQHPGLRTPAPAIMCGVLSLKMNDAAVKSLGLLNSPAAIEPPEGLTADLQERANLGVVCRENVLTWATSVGGAEGAPSFFKDLTAWECSDSSFHLEDFVRVDVAIVDDVPVITEDDQRILLRHGVTFALAFSKAIYALTPPTPVRCIVSANDTNATFRFHQIRPGESWSQPDLDRYQLDKMIVLDIEPTGS